MAFQLKLQCSTVAETHGQVHRQWASAKFPAAKFTTANLTWHDPPPVATSGW